ncbi:DVUA0089 family protein [Polyangium sorediatum]|uniref:DVUA0089 family protein n=1 Tax=Polyangium sorediatum TaxID=889274 RepID=A0ABT6P760_9BACT|nr:DVUA0089 family protein [Polyangium sorediatum]
MSRWRSLGIKRYAAATFALLAACMSASAGCEIISRPDRSDINQSTGGAGGTGGTGGMGACTTPEDCPGADTACRTRTCTAGVCGEELTPMGTPSDAQTAGDCAREICDGQGKLTLENDDTDVLDDQNDCTEDVCNAGQPGNNPLAAGAACASNEGKLCDGAGTCVECLAPADCPENVCANNMCVPAECGDTVKNGAETDVDCGGGTCAPCADGLVCAAVSDCQSSVCDAGVCQAPTCTDTVENGEETDVDCGGATCNACGPGLGCAQDSDCVGDSCSGSICLPTCTDEVTNRNETDVDCGGPNCSPCAAGLICAVNSDCASTVCTAGICQPSNCTDQVQNGTETAVDCGGADCSPCGDGLACNQPTDCQSGICTGNLCQVPTCTDTVKNGAETDADCGGGTCPTCDLGKACLANGDCTSNICAGNVCVLSLCGDGILTGAETCDDGNAVAGDGCDAACALEVGWACTGTPNTCTPNCGDGVLKGAETCDDGNTNPGDGCSATCKAELGYVCTGQPSACKTVCGDGIPAGTEACDDGNMNDDDACLPGCIVATCGDGYVNVATETCDDGNHTPGDGCNATCQSEPFYVCFGTPSTCVLVETEPNAACASASGPLKPPFAITGKISPAGDQDYYAFTVPAVADVRIETFVPSVGTCTTGNDTVIELRAANCTTIIMTDDDDGLNSCSLIDPTTTTDTAARKLAPGTYYVRVEEYQNNAAISAYQLQVTFTALCGNGVITGSETCDDGNTNSGDGCSSSCVVEQGYKCTGAPSVCALSCGNGVVDGVDACDDGNTVGGDGCSSTCVVESGYKCTGSPSVCVAFETLCNDGIDNNSNGFIDAADPNCTLPAYFPACAAGQRLHVYRSIDTPLSIPDNNTTGVTSIINVGATGTIARAAILVNMDHDFMADVDLSLISPGNTTFDVTSDNGSSNDDLINTVFDSTCPNLITNTSFSPPYTGCFAPEASFASLVGTSMQGNWKLNAVDDAGAITGPLQNWALILCTNP